MSDVFRKTVKISDIMSEISYRPIFDYKSRKKFLFPENHDSSRNVFSVISAKHQCCSTTFYLTTSGTVSALQHQWRLLAAKLPFYICVLS
jgi:hypothetical protein